jgi:uncharacterized protein (AIM24 family)
MTRYSLEEFLVKTRQDEKATDYFQLESDRMLEVNLQGEVWCKAGSMVAYVGNIKFEREGILDRGLGNLLRKAVSGEGTPLMKASGQGRLYLANSGKTIQILELNNDSVVVNGNDLLAFEPTITWDVKMMRKLSAVASGGLFNIRMEGTGLLAVTAHFEPLTLIVRPGQPVRTDPNATILWSGNLTPEFKTDVSLKTFLGRGSGESFQMEFSGEGFVVIQPYEESPMQHG